jgi:hypothetical protein
MAGIEAIAVIIIFIVGGIGLVRGSAKELGVTMALVVLLAVMAQFNQLIGINEMPGRVNNVMQTVGLGTDDVLKQRSMVLFLFTAAIALTAFLAYHGHDTLAFRFQEPRGIFGAILGWLVGALNGYLMSGTIWYYANQLDYPMQRYVWFNTPLTQLGQDLVQYLPQNIVSGVVLSGLALVLLWWRILK